VKTLAEISVSSPDDLRPGTLRRDDFEAFGTVLREVRACGVVLVTGTDESRRACALGLAAAAAVGGRRVALLECDLAKPSLAEALGLAPAPGLHEYLRWEAEAGQILQPVMLAGPESGRVTEPLICIAAGKPTSQGPTLLASQSFRHATAKLRAAYDLVVLDGPSAESEAAQLRNVAAAADASLGCVERARSTRRSTKKLRRRLRRLPARFAGLVACD
jgi:succinoglycan biosynthesis transport protein ExoP